jgi:hypothetical protein
MAMFLQQTSCHAIGFAVGGIAVVFALLFTQSEEREQ